MSLFAFESDLRGFVSASGYYSGTVLINLLAELLQHSSTLLHWRQAPSPLSLTLTSALSSAILLPSALYYYKQGTLVDSKMPRSYVLLFAHRRVGLDQVRQELPIGA